MLKLKTSRDAARWMGFFLLPALFAADQAVGADSTNAVSNASPTTDALLNLFIEKGFVTQAEADRVKSEAESLATNNPASYPPPPSQWKMLEGIKQVELFGDVRLRFENREAVDPDDDKIHLERFRYALRFGIRGEAFDNFYYGFRLETAANPRSPWVTLGQSANGSPYQGPFGKSTATLAVGQIYLGWRLGEWLDVTVGKMPNPLYTTPMVWDSDLNPEGAAEHLNYTVGEADFFGTFGQFLYADFNPENASGGLGFNGTTGQSTDDIFMFAWQGGLNYHITPDVSAKIAATLYNYTGLQRSSQFTVGSSSPYFGDPYVGEGASDYYGGAAQGYAAGYAGYSPGSTYGIPGNESLSYPFNQVGLNDLLVLEIPFEVDFKIRHTPLLGDLQARLFGDFAYNLDGASRAEAAATAYSAVLAADPNPSISHSFAPQIHDVKAYQIGFGFGSTNFDTGPMRGVVYGTKTEGNAWEFRTYWQHIEQYSLDPNLIDSDFFEGRENMQGIYAALAYAFTPNFITTLRYGYASRINGLLGTGGSNQDIPQMNPIGNYNLLQLDATFRF